MKNMIKYFKYRLKWHLAPHFNFKSPVHVDIELNNNCNQSCASCWHSSDKLPFEIGFMSNNDIGCIFSYCITNDIKSVKFNWRGEPLIDIGRLSLMSYLYNSENIYTMINTNGKNLKNNIGYLTDINEIIISVDSLEPHNYKVIHNEKIDFMLVLLKTLTLYKKENVLKNKIKLNFHDNKINHEELKHSLKYYKKILGFPIITRFTENREGKDLSIKREKKRKKVCSHMKRRLTVAANGKIFPCCVAYNEPDDLCLGTDIEKAWTSEKRIQLIENYKIGLLTETCKKCTSGDTFRE